MQQTGLLHRRNCIVSNKLVCLPLPARRDRVALRCIVVFVHRRIDDAISQKLHRRGDDAIPGIALPHRRMQFVASSQLHRSEQTT